ncbi:hypothetical protein O181_018856 [Austropuccinia psidii MF-1]|uniref:Uncharacterized protein n=1 Tax=Austropuccinia psidii MF-1 TaxID=1389203 RepID=A0A9Q3GTB3_9BASI|nr:hypothetical protein [Austropuccinia psidii MF-1]
MSDSDSDREAEIVASFLLPADRRSFWTSLPGWVTYYINHHTQLRKLNPSNAQIYDTLCDLWKIPPSFRSAKKVLVLSGGGSNENNSLLKEIVQVIDFLTKNSGASFKKLGWFDPNLLQLMNEGIDENHWVIFPTIGTLSWPQGNIPEQVQKWLRHQKPCRVGVIGDVTGRLTRKTNTKFSADWMQFAEVWDQSFFLTFTSRALHSNINDVDKLTSILEARQYDALDNPDIVKLQIWMSFHTYWKLSPYCPNPTISAIHAFSRLHNPDLPFPALINRDSLHKGLKSISTSKCLWITEILEPLKIPTDQISKYLTAMGQIYRSEEESTEFESIKEISQELINNFWKFRYSFLVVSEQEFGRLAHIILPQCRLVTLKELIRLITNNFQVQNGSDLSWRTIITRATFQQRQPHSIISLTVFGSCQNLRLPIVSPLKTLYSNRFGGRKLSLISNNTAIARIKE